MKSESKRYRKSNKRKTYFTNPYFMLKKLKENLARWERTLLGKIRDFVNDYGEDRLKVVTDKANVSKS